MPNIQNINVSIFQPFLTSYRYVTNKSVNILYICIGNYKFLLQNNGNVSKRNGKYKGDLSIL